MLEVVQEQYLRRILGVGSCTFSPFLFMETGLWPLAYRRLTVAVKYLSYVSKLDESRLVKSAMRESVRMATADLPRGWYLDLQNRLLTHARGYRLPPLDDLTDDHVKDCLDAIQQNMIEDLTAQLVASSKACLAMDQVKLSSKGDPSPAPMAFRHYLTLRQTSRRLVVTKFVMSDHSLGIEMGRRTNTDPEKRLCRLCNNYVETPEHIMFECDRLTSAESTRWRRKAETTLALRSSQSTENWTPRDKFIALLNHHDCIEMFAELAYMAYKAISGHGKWKAVNLAPEMVVGEPG